MCACVRTSAEDDNFPRRGGGGGCVYLTIVFNLSLGFGLSDIALFQVSLGLLGISTRSVLQRMWNERQGVHV